MKAGQYLERGVDRRLRSVLDLVAVAGLFLAFWMGSTTLAQEPGVASEGEETRTRLSATEYLDRIELAGRMFARGRYDRAAALYLELVEQNPDDARFLLLAGNSLAFQGRPEEAIPLLEKALARGQGSRSGTSFELARLYAGLGKEDMACDWLERALAARHENRPSFQATREFDALKKNPRFRKLAGMLPEGELSREEGWAFDLDHLLEEAIRLHADPSQPARSPAFRGAIEALKGQVSELDDSRIATEIQKIMVLLGDGHSNLYPIPTDKVQFPQIPLRFYFFADGLFLLEGRGELESLEGSRVLAIGGVRVEEVKEKLKAYVSRDNDQGIVWIGPTLLTYSHILHDMGCTRDPAEVTLTLEDPSGKVIDKTIEAGSGLPRSKLVPPGTPRGERPTPLYLENVSSNYWFQELEKLGAVYVQFNQVRQKSRESIQRFSERLGSALEESEARYLIVDVRHNNGGNNFLIWPFIRALVHFELGSSENRIFVLCGRNTFSACQNFMNFVERTTHATFVGEPSSSKTNFTGESTTVLLPYSGLSLSISSRYWQDSYPGDDRPFIAPQIPVKLFSEDYYSNRDPVMEAVAEVIRSETEADN